MCDCVDGWTDMAADGPIFCQCTRGLTEAVEWWKRRVRQHELTVAAIDAHDTNGWQCDWRASEERALGYAKGKRDGFQHKLDQLGRDTALPVQPQRRGKSMLMMSTGSSEADLPIGRHHLIPTRAQLWNKGE